MDAIDRKILGVLQQDASLSVAEVGNRVGLSSTPCWKRIQKLEAEGVIQKRVAVVDPDKIGLGVSVFVAIETGDHSEEWLGKFAEAREAALAGRIAVDAAVRSWTPAQEEITELDNFKTIQLVFERVLADASTASGRLPAGEAELRAE